MMCTFCGITPGGTSCLLVPLTIQKGGSEVVGLIYPFKNSPSTFQPWVYLEVTAKVLTS